MKRAVLLAVGLSFALGLIGVAIGIWSFSSFGTYRMTFGWIVLVSIAINVLLVGLWTIMGESLIEDLVKLVIVCAIALAAWRLNPAITASVIASTFLAVLSSQLSRAIVDRAFRAERDRDREGII